MCDAKPIIRQTLIDRGDALPYLEPESLVMSRSGDECIVALTDQWYLSYGDPEWLGIVNNHMHGPNFNSYNDKILERFDMMLNWLKEWACSRQFGLGTQLPWDTQWVIESLSDSTIYMAYYTIAHYFHGDIDRLSGSLSTRGIDAEQLTDEVFDYVFLGRPYPNNSTIPQDILLSMKREFEYWYPMDLRVSAKDLVPNHLTMCLYNHVEIWKDRPELWPRGIYCNGHVMVDAEKMSKQRGNFLLLLQCVEEYSADATRFALADAGDTMEDANFDRAVANQAIMYLFNEEEWIRTVVGQGLQSNTLRRDTKVFMDLTFSNEMNYLIEQTKDKFEKLCYRDGIHKCWFDMIIARDLYRDWCTRCGVAMHIDVLLRFVESLAVMISPICPHWSENIWEMLGREGFVCDASWPAFEPYDRLLRKQYIFFRDFMKNIRVAALKAKGKEGTQKNAYIYVSNGYDKKKVVLLKFLQSIADEEGGLPADLMVQMKNYLESQPELKADTKLLMQFGAFMRDEAKERGLDALATELPFDQRAILEAST